MQPMSDHGPHLAHGLAGEELPPGEDRLLTLPNLVTFLRLLCLPLYLWLLFGQDDRLAAALLLLALGCTDWVDGYLARRLGQVSNFGKMFDPTVDRLLMVVGVVSIMLVSNPRAVPVWFAVVVLFREVVMSAFVAGITVLGARRMDVTWVGKAGTFLMMGVWPAFLAASDTALPDALRTLLLVAAWAAAVPGLVLGYMAFVSYVPAGLAALREGRAMRAASAEA